MSKGTLLCCCCIRLLLSGDAKGYSVPFLLEDVFADLGLGKPDGLGRSGGSLGIGCGLEFGELASFCRLPGLLGIEGPLGRGKVCSVSGRSQPLLLSLLRGGSLCGGFVLSLLAVVGLLGEVFSRSARSSRSRMSSSRLHSCRQASHSVRAAMACSTAWAAMQRARASASRAA